MNELGEGYPANPDEWEADWLEFTAPEGSSEREAWRPSTEAEVDWVIQNAMRADARLREVRALAEEKIRRVKAWLEQHEKRLEPELNHWEALAVTWFKEYREQLLASGVPEARLPKTMAFDSGGKLTARVSQGSTIVHDSELAVRYLYHNGYRNLVKVTREPIKSEVKKHVRETGEIIPGIEVEEPGVNLKLSL